MDVHYSEDIWGSPLPLGLLLLQYEMYVMHCMYYMEYIEIYYHLVSIAQQFPNEKLDRLGLHAILKNKLQVNVISIK